MKIKTVLVMLAVFMLSGCFFSEDLTPEEQAEKVKQSDIRTAKIVGNIECIKGQYVYFNDQVLSFSQWNTTVKFIDKEGTLHIDSISNCAFKGNKGEATNRLENFLLFK